MQNHDIGSSFRMESPLFTLHRARIAELVVEGRLPSMALLKGLAETSCLMTYGPRHAGLARRAAAYVDNILKGATPGDLPVERLMTFELAINLKTAKTLGLTILPALLWGFRMRELKGLSRRLDATM